MQITLNGKTYIAPTPKGRMVRKAYELIEKLSPTEVKTSDLDELAAYAVELFGGQFTIDDFYDGIVSKEMLPTLGYFVNLMLGRIKEKLDQLPNG